MNIYDNGYVYENVFNEYIVNVNKEVNMASLLALDYRILFNYFKQSTVVPVFRFFMLNEDETVHYEFSKDVVSADLKISCQSGQRRKLNLTLTNINNQWSYGARGTLWSNTKVRFDCGVVINNVLYWQTQGIYMLEEPTHSIQPNGRSVSLSLCDKWGLWSNIYGKTQYKTIIPTEVPMQQVFNTIVHEDNGLGYMWDTKPIKFNTRYADTLTYYTIRKDEGQQKAENLLDMAKTISSDIYYDTFGCMNVENNSLDFINNNFPIVWRYEEGDRDCGNFSLSYNRADYCNRIITKGAIVDGLQFTATAENKNIKSLYNIYDTPVVSKVNKNTKLYSNNLCLEQSMYEMVAQSRGLRSVSLEVGFLPFLDVNMGVFLNFPSVGINNTSYIVDSISYNISKECKMNIVLTSNYEVIF